jgi:FkbM family methyltransferase
MNTSRLLKPHYVFRPRQALLRATSRERLQRPEARVVLPWGGSMLVDPRDRVGSGIARTGVYDLAVSEALVRLLDPSEVALDIGANVGFMSGAMAARSGPNGRVLSFEPNPSVLAMLRANVFTVGGGRAAPICLHEVALSSRSGTATLRAGSDFERNRGTASLTVPGASDGAFEWQVDTARLDDVIGEQTVGVAKLDVEGHEGEVLRGAAAALASRRIRDLVLEDLDDGDATARRILIDEGYEILGLGQSLLGPTASRGSTPLRRNSFDPPSFIATLDGERALARLRRRGWRILNPRLFGAGGRQ